jgi:hypothetical protein
VRCHVSDAGGGLSHCDLRVSIGDWRITISDARGARRYAWRARRSGRGFCASSW